MGDDNSLLKKSRWVTFNFSHCKSDTYKKIAVRRSTSTPSRKLRSFDCRVKRRTYVKERISKNLPAEGIEIKREEDDSSYVVQKGQAPTKQRVRFAIPSDTWPSKMKKLKSTPSTASSTK